MYKLNEEEISNLISANNVKKEILISENTGYLNLSVKQINENISLYYMDAHFKRDNVVIQADDNNKEKKSVA